MKLNRANPHSQHAYILATSTAVMLGIRDLLAQRQAVGKE